MTREEALKYRLGRDFYDQFEVWECDVLVNKIYDDFNSRTCENCKYYERNVPLYGEHEGSCLNYIVVERDFGTVIADFGCNKFVRKDT